MMTEGLALYLEDILETKNRINYGRLNTEELCDYRVLPLVDALFEKMAGAELTLDNYELVENTANLVMYLSNNAKKKDCINDEMFVKVKESFDLMNEILDSCYTEETAVPQAKALLNEKILCITAVLFNNDISGKRKVFYNFEHLKEIMFRFWKEDSLYQRGLNCKLVQMLMETLNYETLMLTEFKEESRFKEFMAFLDGNMKLIPNYVRCYILNGFMLADIETVDEIVSFDDNKPEVSHYLQ